MYACTPKIEVSQETEVSINTAFATTGNESETEVKPLGFKALCEPHSHSHFIVDDSVD